MSANPSAHRPTAAELEEWKKELAHSLGLDDLLIMERWPNPSMRSRPWQNPDILPLRSFLP